MKIEINIPDPKFKVFDIVRIDNSRNDKHIFFHVINVQATGRFAVFGNEKLPDIHIEIYNEPNHLEEPRFYYTVVTQKGSFYNTEDIEELPAGMTLLYGEKILLEKNAIVDECFDLSLLVDANLPRGYGG